MKKQKNKKNIFLLLLALSLFLHVLTLLVKVGLEKDPGEAPREKIVKLQLQPPTGPRPPSTNPSQQQRETQRPKQIVNNDNQGRQEKPKDSRFLGEKNQTYDRQTQAKNVDSHNIGGVGQKGKEDKKPIEKKVAKEKTKPTSLGDFALGSKAVPTFDESPEKTVKERGEALGDPSRKGLTSNNDYIDDVALGDATHLNTTEFKYYGFYFRIRQKLEQYWGMGLREKAQALFKSGRKLAMNETHITSVEVELDPFGKILNVSIKGTSGVKELDDAAVESFRKAGPFPNPPQGMLVKGRVVLSWGFVVKS